MHLRGVLQQSFTILTRRLFRRLRRTMFPIKQYRGQRLHPRQSTTILRRGTMLHNNRRLNVIMNITGNRRTINQGTRRYARLYRYYALIRA